MVWAFQILREKGLWDLIQPVIIQALGTNTTGGLNVSAPPLSSSRAGTSGTTKLASSSSAGTGTAQAQSSLFGAQSTFMPPDIERVLIIISKTSSKTDSSFIIPIVMRFCTEPEQLWIAFKQKYWGQYESVATQSKLGLKRFLVDLKMTEGTLVQDYLHSIKRHVAELKCVDKSVPDQ